MKPTFLDGFNAILTADTNLFQGQYKEKITEVFKARGIGKSTPTGTVIDGSDVQTIKRFRGAHGE